VRRAVDDGRGRAARFGAVLCLFFALLLLCGEVTASPGVSLPPEPDPTEDLTRARAIYDRGDYDEAAKILSPLLYPQSRGLNTSELKDAHRFLGISYFYLDRREQAKQELVALLYLDPDYELDPVIESADVYAFFESLKADLRDQLEAIRRQKQIDEQKKQRPAKEILIIREIHKRSPIANFAPLGIPQFENGQKAKGIFFLVAEAALGGTSVVMFALQIFRYGLPPRIEPSESEAYRSLQVLQLGTGGLFFLTYGWGVIDAFANQKPTLTETRTERVLEPALGMVPLLRPDAVGVGYVWEF
jgi:tetratricopeptide (TPR) repeat protein